MHKTGLGFHTSKTRHEENHNGRYASIVKGKRASFAKNIYFTKSFDEPSGKGGFEMRHSLLYFFSLVRISELFYTNFSSTCNSVRISSKASATAVSPFTPKSDQVQIPLQPHQKYDITQYEELGFS